MKNIIYIAIIGIVLFSSCSKNNSLLKSDFQSSKNNNSDSDNPISISDIPQTALDYITANFADYVLDNAYTEDEDGQILNTVEVSNSTNTLEVKFDSNWNFVKSEVADENESEGDNENGNEVDNENDEISIAIADIPQTALDYISSNFSGYTVDVAYQEDEDGQILNTVEIINANDRICVKFDSNWNFVKSENDYD